jgi:hypothetical protein
MEGRISNWTWRNVRLHRSLEHADGLSNFEALEIATNGHRFNESGHVYSSSQALATQLQFFWAHRLRPMVAQYWRCVAGASALVGTVEAGRRRQIVTSAGFLSVAAIIASTGLAFRRRDGPIDNLKVYTAKQLDKMVEEAGLMECDCGPIVSSIPMDRFVQGTLEEIESLDLLRVHATACDADDWDGSVPNEFQVMLCFVRQLVAKPNPLLGRKGPVCPFIPKSLQLDAVRMTVVRTRAMPRHNLRRALGELLVDFIPMFEAMQPTTGRQRVYKTVIFIFPDIALSDASDVIDGTQADVKHRFVAKGLMVGEFHAAKNETGLHNSSFFPLRAPFPCLVVRHMVPGDLVFMTLDNYSVDVQRKFLTCFLDVFRHDDDEVARTAFKKLQELS